MREEDLDAVLRIEEDAYPHPWSRGIFADCLKVGYQCRVYEKEGEIVGYSVHSAAAGEGHLLNLCVAPQHQSQGHGRRMLRKVMAEMREPGGSPPARVIKKTRAGTARIRWGRGSAPETHSTVAGQVTSALGVAVVLGEASGARLADPPASRLPAQITARGRDSTRALGAALPGAS